MSRRLVTALACAGAALAGAPAAHAAFAPGAELASATTTQVGDGTSGGAVLSDDGRYAVFVTTAPALLGPSPDPQFQLTRGAVRKDLFTGAIELVAPPERRRVADGAAAGGQLRGSMSVSADGQYVLFGTTAQLTPGDGNLATEDVYLRDMTRAYSDSAAYELVSALHGSQSAPLYGNLARGSRPGARGAALSDDGRTAAFVTTGASSLPAGDTTAPAGQVLVRALDAHETHLVTRDLADPSPLGTAVPAAGETPEPVLAGDATAIAWNAEHAERLASFLPGEPAGDLHLLWRDLTAPPATPARQVSGIADADDPACDVTQPYVHDREALGPCYGPFALGELAQIESAPGTPIPPVPLSISDDGDTVAWTNSAPTRPFASASFRDIVWLADMRPGVSRKAGTRSVVSTALGAEAPLQPVLSGDGSRLTFTSRNRQFDGPRPLGGFPTSSEATMNVFQVDLAENSVERVTTGADGTDYLGRLDPNSNQRVDPTARELAVSEDGGVVAFSAEDGNAAVGDVNRDTDVLVARRAFVVPPAPDTGAPPAPPVVPRAEPPVQPLPPRFPVVGFPRVGADGVATIRVRVPAAGRLTARAKGPGGLAVDHVARRLPRARTVTVRLEPSRRVRRALERGRTLRVAARIAYAAADAPAVAVSRRYTLTPRHAR